MSACTSAAAPRQIVGVSDKKSAAPFAPSSTMSRATSKARSSSNRRRAMAAAIPKQTTARSPTPTKMS